MLMHTGIFFSQFILSRSIYFFELHNVWGIARHFGMRFQHIAFIKGKNCSSLAS